MLYTVTDFSKRMFVFPASNKIALTFVFLQLICKRSEETSDFLNITTGTILLPLIHPLTSCNSSDSLSLFSSVFCMPFSFHILFMLTFSSSLTFTFSRPTCYPCLSEVMSEVLLPLLWQIQPWALFTSSCPKGRLHPVLGIVLLPVKDILLQPRVSVSPGSWCFLDAVNWNAVSPEDVQLELVLLDLIQTTFRSLGPSLKIRIKSLKKGMIFLNQSGCCQAVTCYKAVSSSGHRK